MAPTQEQATAEPETRSRWSDVSAGEDAPVLETGQRDRGAGTTTTGSGATSRAGRRCCRGLWRGSGRGTRHFRAAFGANIDTASLATWDSAAGSDTTRSGSRCRTGLW